MSKIYRSPAEDAERKKLIKIFSIIYTAAILVIIILLVTTLSYNKVYAGVTLNNQDVSGMTKEEITNMIESKYNETLSSSIIYFTENKETVIASVSLKDLSISFNTQAIVEEVYKPGHEGSMFGRLSEILKLSNKGRDIDVFAEREGGELAKYDEVILNRKISEVISGMASETLQHNISKSTDENGNPCLKIIAGRAGVAVDRDLLKQKILEASVKMESSYIEITEIAKVEALTEFDINKIYDEFNKPAINAKYVRSGSDIIILPDTKGELVNISDLVTVSNKIATAGSDEVFTVPLVYKDPDVKTSDLPPVTFNDVIGKGSTSFGGSTSSRATNIKVGTAALNDRILLPGESFSFNTDIGDTTADKGYVPGISIEEGQRVETYGGGICQVSTTLYNALINGGVEITKRSNHSEKVGYIGWGMDAAIAYPGKDIAFKNNLLVPIKIVGIISGSTVTFEIRGVNLNKGTKYSYNTEKVDEFTSEGKRYHVYQTYRTVTVNGSVTENKKPFFKSTYYMP